MGLLQHRRHFWNALKPPASAARCLSSFSSPSKTSAQLIEVCQQASSAAGLFLFEQGASHSTSHAPCEVFQPPKLQEKDDAQSQFLWAVGAKIEASGGSPHVRAGWPTNVFVASVDSVYGLLGDLNKGSGLSPTHWHDEMRRLHGFGCGFSSSLNNYIPDVLNMLEFFQDSNQKHSYGPFNGLTNPLGQGTTSTPAETRKNRVDLVDELLLSCDYRYSPFIHRPLEKNPGRFPRGLLIDNLRIEADSVKRKRKRKMNKHKHRKLRRRLRRQKKK